MSNSSNDRPTPAARPTPTARPTIAIPLWVTIFALFVCVLGGALGFMTLVVQTDPGMTVSWGGRTIGLAIVTGMAVYLKSPILYMGAFAGGMARDVGDLIAEISKVDSSTGVTVGTVLFILLGIGGFIAANVSRKSEAGIL